jgi:hypothetical protein
VFLWKGYEQKLWISSNYRVGSYKQLPIFWGDRGAILGFELGLCALRQALLHTTISPASNSTVTHKKIHFENDAVYYTYM